MNAMVCGSFLGLSLLCLLLQLKARRTQTETSVWNSPEFLKFQRGYLAAYLMAMFADCLQGPYLYQLYSYYGFHEQEIAILFVFGFASTVVIGMWAPLAADRFERKKLCLSFAVLYLVSCLMKLSRSYGVLILGRFIGGVATSVLFSAFEAWYIHEHTETYDFPKEWIPVTFSKAETWNGALAVVAGLITAMVSDRFHLGPVGPYMLAVPFLIFAAIIVSTHWTENYSGNKIRFKKACSDGIKTIMSKEIIFVFGVIEALMESVIFVVTFLWTPIMLNLRQPSLGVIFSCFMVCILLGQAVFQLCFSRHMPVALLLLVSTVTALVANILLVISTSPFHFDNLSFWALLLFQFALGLYFSAVEYLRHQIIPEANLWRSRNWLRVPMTLISCVILILHTSYVFIYGDAVAFVVCSFLLGLASLFGARLARLAKNHETIELEYV